MRSQVINCASWDNVFRGSMEINIGQIPKCSLPMAKSWVHKADTYTTDLHIPRFKAVTLFYNLLN